MADPIKELLFKLQSIDSILPYLLHLRNIIGAELQEELGELVSPLDSSIVKLNDLRKKIFEQLAMESVVIIDGKSNVDTIIQSDGMPCTE